MTNPRTLPAIREFEPGDETAFRTLNEEWIIRHFVALESKDEASLASPQRNILDRGGRIFFAVSSDDRPIGCCALLLMAPGEFEVAKMCVTEAAQGTGTGRRLLEKVIA